MLWKKWALLLGVLLLTGSSFAGEAEIRKAIQAAYPKLHVEKISKTPYNGLYEVYLNGQIIYTDDKFSFLIVEGRLVDPKTKTDVTRERLEALTRIDFSTLPLDQAIKVVKGNGSRKIAVFSDPDCPYCKRLEDRELSKIDNVTVYTFLYPLEQLHPDAGRKATAIWCSADRGKAWQDWMLNNQLPKAAECATPLDKVADLGRKLGVNSTPTIFLSDGRRIQGAYPADELEKAMQEAAAKN